MKRALPLRRRLTAVLAIAAASMLTSLSLSATTASAQAPTSAPSGCASAGASKVGRIGGITHAVSASTGCAARESSAIHIASDPAIGKPPLIFHGGPVMGTRSTGPLVVTPIFWSPAGTPMDPPTGASSARYLKDVADASGKRTNVFSTLNEYFGTNGAIRYNVDMRTAVVDTHPLPADGCTVASTDSTGIYADGSGYDACLDDAQIIAETDSIVTARGLPRDYGHIYVMFLPKHVESCFFPGSTTDREQRLHDQPPAERRLLRLPQPGPHAARCTRTCRSRSTSRRSATRAAATPRPRGDRDAERQPRRRHRGQPDEPRDHGGRSPTRTSNTGWYDASGFENGDECAYVYGADAGHCPAALYNQVINGHHYLTQEEFSNIDFAKTGGGCIQGTSTKQP